FQIAEAGGTPTLTECATPQPTGDMVQVQIAACGLNFADMLMIQGKYQDTPPYPFTLGMEIAGTITAIGPEAPADLMGKRVSVFAGSGGLAEYGVFPADRCTIMPDSMSFEDAAAFQIAYGTSHVALDHRAHLQPGENLVVLGAAGGVGLTAVEIGARIGANVIAVAR
ncbi:alcohol dehydrogenase catalytic domain-containing protein, partial [Escherichia coli]|nr:alcohol dehydrogenase catalytic domain-containing protein [Escherichia coli]